MTNKYSETIEAGNGNTISANFYIPTDEIMGAIIIASAMGVSQKYYASFASWLSACGYMVVTFDYSGTWLSQNGRIEESSVTISDWANVDCSLIIDVVSKRVEGKPLYWVGHSLGGQIFGLIPNSKSITKVFTIVSGTGYWLESPPTLRWRVWWLWYIVAPLMTRIFGYFPGKQLKKVGDLPSGVIYQWRKWCLHPDYLFGEQNITAREKYSLITAPIISFSVSDDELLTQNNIESLHEFYDASSIKLIRLSPEIIGVNHIGHFGFFKSKFKTTLWEKYFLPELCVG